MRRFIALFLFASSLAAQTSPTQNIKPKTPMDWFIRAGERMTLRVPGAAPFHLHVTFHANPGQEMLTAKEKSYFIAGDGVYDEVWLGPHKWRREVTLAAYHAVETETNGVRKMQASSDYVPSRVWMLLDSLHTPVPRALTTKEFHKVSGWKIEPVSTSDLSLVRLSKTLSLQHGKYTESYFFLPRTGVLAMSNRNSVVTIWSDDIVFDAKVVPRGLTIRCLDKELLTAQITIEPAGQTDKAGFDLPGPAAEPGMTLRPLHWYEIRIPVFSESRVTVKPAGDSSPPVYAMTGMVDRHGNFRELEILAAPNPVDVVDFIQRTRDLHRNPAIIDGSRCQYQAWWLWN